MVLPRTPALRTLVASQVRAGSRLAARRFYANQAGHGAPQKKSDLPWLITSLALTVPAAVYLYNSGPPETEHGIGPQRPVMKGDDGPHDHKKAPQPAPEEVEEKKPEEEKPAEEVSEEEAAPAAEEGDNRPSERDPPRAYKGAESPAVKSGAQSAKQQGLSNTETKHPWLESSGKSAKAEGDTDSAKLQGTLAPERPKYEDNRV
ncbi:hypothetical protein VTN77DRAFT_5200 [Rasamsonia byssochlamydoides]|uniref:uncharacterized protein n=1 Tax=Rasamsonia byssochlamydoides TaxID=89139 RepID=UPI003741ED73